MPFLTFISYRQILSLNDGAEFAQMMSQNWINNGQKKNPRK